MILKFLLSSLLLATQFTNLLAQASQVKVIEYAILNTKYGAVRGTVEEFQIGGAPPGENILRYQAYRGMPYAEPPIGERRWKDPVVKQPFPLHMTYNATVRGPHCPQLRPKFVGNEDCLYADVFIPVQTTEKKLLKIMVFFHGGGFIANSDWNTLPLPLLKENVIVIMFNYRIHIFGYLSTGTRELPGNYGALDQIAMLQWVKQYGKDFGGDPRDVTVFGSSIGSVSIHYLLLTKLAKGLFNRAIMQSGSAFCERSLVPNPLDIAAKLGSQVNCSTENVDPAKLVSCLRTKSTEELMTAAKTLLVQYILPSVLAPVIDKSSRPAPTQFLLDYPEKLPVVINVPVIVGITANEGLSSFLGLVNGPPNYNLEQLNDLTFIEKTILPHYLNLIMRSRKNNQSRNEYIDKLASEAMALNMEQFQKDSIPAIIGTLGDLWINACHRKTVQGLCSSAENRSPIYAYLFTQHDPKTSPAKNWKHIEALRQRGVDHPIFDYGSAHTEENLYLLETENNITRLDLVRNRKTSKMLSALWSDFTHEKKLFFNVSRDGGYISQEWTPVCNQYDPLFNEPEHIFPLQEISLDNVRNVAFRINETSFWWKVHQDTFST